MDKYNKLTEAARDALDNSIEEFKGIILDKAYQNASRENSNTEISLQDVLKAKQSILQSNHSIDYRDNRKRRLALLITIAGFVYAICGILIYIYQNFNVNIERDFGLIIASIGSVVSMTGFILIQLIYNNNSFHILTESRVLESELIKKWDVIESLGATLMKKNGVATNEKSSINSIIEFILENLSANIEQSKLKELIVARNSVVHNSNHISTDRLLDNIGIANKIIFLLEHKIHS